MLAIGAPKGPRKTQDRRISPGKGRFGSIARGPLGQDRGKMVAIEAPKGPRKTQERRISPGKGRFGSIARGPLGQDRGEMLAIEAPKGPKKDRQKIRASALVRAGLAPLRRGPWAKIGGGCWQ